MHRLKNETNFSIYLKVEYRHLLRNAFELGTADQN